MRPRQHWIFDNRAYSCSKEGKTWKKQKKKKTGTRICRVSRGCKRFTRNYIFKMPVRTDFWSGADRGMVFQQSPRYANRGECAVIFAYAERYDQGSTLAWAYCLSGIDIRVSSSDFPIENAHRKIPQYFKICGSTNWFLPHGSIHLKTEFVRNIYISFVRCFLRIGLRCSSRTTFFYVKKCI